MTPQHTIYIDLKRILVFDNLSISIVLQFNTLVIVVLKYGLQMERFILTEVNNVKLCNKMFSKPFL